MLRRLAALALLALLAGCASPNPNLYTLRAMAGAEHHIGARTVELRRIGLAGYLDRPEIVRTTAQYRLMLASNDRWGEPLGSMLDRVFTEDLLGRLPGTAVFTESGAISTNPDRVLEIDVQRFDADADGTLVLVAQVAVRHGDERQSASVRTVRLTDRPASPALSEYVAAMSRALAQLADEVAGMLAASSQPPPHETVNHDRLTHRLRQS
jgi:uncharacterized lipoprotein YmbA